MTVQAKGQDQDSLATAQATSSGLAISIDSVGPDRYATPGSTIVVKGTITNDTGEPADGVTVQLQTSDPFTTRSVMEDYDTGQGEFYPDDITGAIWPDGAVLHSNATVSWTASFSASDGQFSFSGLNVYPLVAAVYSANSGGNIVDSARTLLPFYPGAGAANDAPQKLDIAWVWPLEDQPQQSACPQDLATNDLAPSFQSGGRLNGLLSAGLRYAASTRLTWAVDPALLSDAKVMSSPYKVGGDAGCTDTTVMPASQQASTWLSALQAGTASDPNMFVTAYADPDLSALTHAGLGSQIAKAYSLGNIEAEKILGRSFGSGAKIAWPDGGNADASVLTTLAQQAGVSTTVLNSTEMPVASYATPYVGDDAVAHITTGIGTPMNVLLADSEITALLGSATASSSASAQFDVTQDFLAETAMIVAQAPNSQRSVVIAPPNRWDPSQAEADTLLSLTSSPWLQPVTLSSLTSRKAASTDREALPATRLVPQELSRNYMADVNSAQVMVNAFVSLLYDPNSTTVDQLAAAVAVTESAAWRGKASARGTLALANLQTYIRQSEERVKIVSSTKVLLAGNSGETPVSVSNGLPVPVQVHVRVSIPPGSQISIQALSPIVVLGRQTATEGMKVHSAALGSTLLQLQLVTKDGTPLPGATQTLSVETTRFGRTLLILIAAALGVLVLASLARWTRRLVARLRNGGGGHHVRGKNVNSGGAGDGSASTSSASGAGSGSGGTG